MPVIEIADGTTPVEITTNSNLIFMREDSYLTVDGTALSLEGTFSNQLIIDGHIYSDSQGIGGFDNGSLTTLTIGQTGSVYGFFNAIGWGSSNSRVDIVNLGSLSSRGTSGGAATVVLSSNFSTFLNDGAITAVGTSVLLSGNGLDVVNTGSIASGFVGIFSFAEDISIDNSGSINAGRDGIRFAGADGGGTVTNSGMITGTEHSIFGGINVELITNTGMLHGDVSLDAGDDLLDSRNGEVNGRVLAGAGDDTVILGSEDNFVDGRAGADMIRGGGGDDEIQGGSGADELRGGAGDDDIIGEDSNDDVYGGHGDDNLRGNSGADRLFGGTGNDVLAGGSGDDRMNGGRDDDVLTGNGGEDLFIFNRQAGNDEITDFNDGVDLIDLRAFNVSTADVLAATSVVGGNSIIDLEALGGTGSILIEGDTSMSATDFLV